MTEPQTQEAYAYTDGASTGSRGPGGYGAVMTWKGKTQEISGGEQDTTNLRMELTAACVALETIDEGHIVTVYSDSSYLVNCMRRGWYKKWRENGWLNHRKEPVANRDLWERLLEAEQCHQEVLWRKVRGHSKTQGPHKSGNDRADELAVAAKKKATRPSIPSSTPALSQGRQERYRPNGPCPRMRNMAEHPSVRSVLAPYDSGHRGLRMGAGPDHLMEGGLPEMLRSAARPSLSFAHVLAVALACARMLTAPAKPAV